MLWAILAVAAVAGAWVVYKLLFLETAPVKHESTITSDKPVRTTKSKAEKIEKKMQKQVANAKKDAQNFVRKFKDSDDEEEEKAKPNNKVAAVASPSSPAKTAFVQPAPSKKAQNRSAKNGFQEVKIKPRSTVTDEERERREAARKEEEEERKKKEEARKLKQKERAEREEKEKEKQKEASAASTAEQSIKDLLEKQRREKEQAKAARTTKGGVVKVFSSPQSQTSDAAAPVAKVWEASASSSTGETNYEDDESFPQLGRK